MRDHSVRGWFASSLLLIVLLASVALWPVQPPAQGSMAFPSESSTYCVPPIFAAPTEQPYAWFRDTVKWVRGKFLTYLNTHGKVPRQGNPISEDLKEVSEVDHQEYKMQYFQYF